MAKIRVTLVRSGIGDSWDIKATLRSLGLKKREQSVTHEDSPAVRGMIFKVRHLVKVEVASRETR